MRWTTVRGRWSTLRDAVRTSLWPMPVLGVAAAIALGVGLPRLDARVDRTLPGAVTDYLFGGGAAAARTVLSAVAGSLITVTSLTFSLTVVTLQLASSQFSPRLLRTFTRDWFVHATLALFLATFTYALTVLRTVRTSSSGGQQEFVPQFAVTAAFVLALASVIVLVLFLAHLAQEIRVETMLRNVHREASATARRLLERGDARPSTRALPAVPAAAAMLRIETSGFLLEVDEQALLAAMVDTGAVVLIERTPGDSLIAGTPLGWSWSSCDGSLDIDVQSRLAEQVASAITIGFEPTAREDVAFGLRQLVDVAVKALSPGINDPTTAVHALGHASALLCQYAGHNLGPRLLRDEDGAVRVALARPDLADLLELAVGQPRRYGASDPAVLARLLRLLGELAWMVRRPGDQRAVADQLARVQQTVIGQDFDAAERANLAALARHVDRALAGQWAPIGQPPAR